MCFIKNVLLKWYWGGTNLLVQLENPIGSCNREPIQSSNRFRFGNTPESRPRNRSGSRTLKIVWEPLLIWLIRISNYKGRISLRRTSAGYESVESLHWRVLKERVSWWRVEHSDSEFLNFTRILWQDAQVIPEEMIAHGWHQNDDHRTCEIGHLDSLGIRSSRLKL